MNARIDKGKNVMHTYNPLEDDDEYYQSLRRALPLSLSAKLVILTKSESSEEVKVLANRMAQLEFSLKDKNTVRS